MRDYFIVDYLSACGKFQEAADIYESLIGQIKAHGDTLGDMMHYAKKGLADVCKSMGDFERATSLYEQVLEISDTLQAHQTRNLRVSPTRIARLCGRLCIGRFVAMDEDWA